MSIEAAEKRFIRLPSESIRHCAERVGIQTSAEVSNALVEDVSFRIRQITDIAAQFMRHAKRRRLTVEDFDKALKWSGIEPLYGHHAPEAPHFTPVNEMMLYSVPDPEVKLEDIATATPVMEHALPDPPSVKATWLSVEGVAIGNTESGDTSSQDQVIINRTPNEAQEKYLSLLLEAVTGDSEDLRRLALADIQSNPSIANILPDLAQYLDEILGRWSQFTPVQLLKVFKLLLSLFRNSSVFLEPYGHCVYPHLKAIILDSAYLSCGAEFDHWHVRQLAAASMAQLMHRYGSPLSSFSRNLYSAFRYQFSLLTQQNPSSLPILFSILATLLRLGGQSAADVLLPHLEPLSGHLQALLKVAKPSVKEDALRVYSVLLEVASLLLTSDVHVSSKQLQAVSSSSTSLSPPYPSSAASSQQPQQTTLSTSSPPYPTSSTPSHPSSSSSQVRSNQPPTDAGFLLPNTTFGLGGEKSDLDGSEASLGGVVGGRGADMMEETPLEQSSLYTYLFDIFGESLGLRLSGCDALFKRKKSSTAAAAPLSQQIGEAASAQQQQPSSKDIRHVNKAVVEFLSREGFKPAKVELPYSRPPPPRQQGHGGYGEWRSQTSFHIPRSLLPVQWNTLEQGMRMGHGQQQQQYRGRVKTGISVSYKRRLHKLRHSSDIGSSWL